MQMVNELGLNKQFNKLHHDICVELTYTLYFKNRGSGRDKYETPAALWKIWFQPSRDMIHRSLRQIQRFDYSR